MGLDYDLNHIAPDTMVNLKGTKIIGVVAEKADGDAWYVETFELGVVVVVEDDLAVVTLDVQN